METFYHEAIHISRQKCMTYLYEDTNVCMYICMYVCMYIYMYAFMYVV